jgi:hypothetical protein
MILLESYVARLTANMEAFVQRDEQTIAAAHELLWTDITQLRHDANWNNIVSTWKYGKEIQMLEEITKNEAKPFGKHVTWEQSYVFGLLLYCFH